MDVIAPIAVPEPISTAAEASYTELAELAGGFIHELKNHLSTLNLNLQLLAEDLHEAQTQRERRAHSRIERVQKQCAQLVDIANDFLRFARLKDLQRTPTDLARVIEQMIDFFAPMAGSSNIDLKSYVSGDLPLVPLDVELFKQALLNLMLNAQQAMPQGGEITIQATRDVGGQQPGVVFSLIDTGAGMSPDVKARIFQPFFSTKKDGSGLGLLTTRRIIEMHGGSIDVESEVGRGTKFTIRLPVDTKS